VNQNPIFLIGSHRSGARLLRHLLDGHSQLFCVPIETHFFKLMHYWVDYDYHFERPKRLPQDQILERFNFWIHRCNQSKDPFADSAAYGLFNEEKFQFKLIDLFDVNNDKKCFEAYMQAVYYALTGDTLSDGLRLVEKSIEHAEFAQDLKRFYPRAKFIHIVRNPFATMVSLRKYKSIDYGYPMIKRIILTLYNHYYFLYQNRRTISNYHVLRYEDLVMQPKKQLDEICDFLEIPFESTLLSPTHQGKIWQGRSMSGEVFQNIESRHLDSWKTQINPMEVEYVNRFFPFVLEDYQYASFKMQGSFWKPQKGESFSRYLHNRLLKYFLHK